MCNLVLWTGKRTELLERKRQASVRAKPKKEVSKIGRLSFYLYNRNLEVTCPSLGVWVH